MLKFPEATEQQKQAVKLFVDNKDKNAVKVTLSNENQRNRKFVVWKNKVYLGHTENGTVYYGSKVVEGDNTTAVFRTNLKAGGYAGGSGRERCQPADSVRHVHSDSRHVKINASTRLIKAIAKWEWLFYCAHFLLLMTNKLPAFSILQ